LTNFCLSQKSALWQALQKLTQNQKNRNQTMKSLLATLLKTNQSNLRTAFDKLVSNNINTKKFKQDTLEKFTDFLSGENTKNLTKYYYSLKEPSIVDKGVRIFREYAAKNNLIRKIVENQ
jgi:hypothetical protein